MPGGRSWHACTVPSGALVLTGFTQAVGALSALGLFSFSHLDLPLPACEYGRPIVEGRPDFSLRFMFQVKFDPNCPSKPPFVDENMEVWGEIGTHGPM